MKFRLHVRKTEEKNNTVYKGVVEAVDESKTQAQHVFFLNFYNKVAFDCDDTESDMDNDETIDHLFAFMEQYGLEIHNGKKEQFFYFYTNEIPDSLFSIAISKYHPIPLYRSIDMITQ